MTPRRLRRRYVLLLGIACLVLVMALGSRREAFRSLGTMPTDPLTCGDVCHRWTWVVFGRAVYPDTYAPVLVVLIFWALIAWLVRTSRSGPVVVEDVVDPTGSTAPGVNGSARAQQVAAILRDRLARSGTAPAGLFPSYTQIDSGAEESLSASPIAVSGYVARIGYGLFRTTTKRLGWRLLTTIRTADDGQRGLTVVLEHTATGRHDLVRTVWNDSLAEAAREAAYIVSAWYQSRVGVKSSRSAPVGRVSSTSLRCIEDARYHLAERRFDESIDAARKGLEDDPTNLALRRILGEVYERLGLSLSALDVYASAIVQILDSDNSWSSIGHETGRRAWPYSDLRRDGVRLWTRGVVSLLGFPRAGARRQLRVRSVEALGLLWRYLFVLSVSEQWVDRWVITVMRRETVWRSRSEGSWYYPSGWTGTEPAGLAREELALERREREELAKRMRGFLATRYEDLLDAEFPLLRAAWFAEQADRSQPFLLPAREEDDAPAPPRVARREPTPRPSVTRGTPPPPWPLRLWTARRAHLAVRAAQALDDARESDEQERRAADTRSDPHDAPSRGGVSFQEHWFAHEAARFPEKEPLLGDIAPTTFEPIVDTTHETLWGVGRREWVAELRAFFMILRRLAREVLPAGAAEVPAPKPGPYPATAERLLVEALRRLRLPASATAFDPVVEALDPELSRPAVKAWHDSRLDRVSVVEAATWAAHHLPACVLPGALALSDAEKALCLRLRAQLDLRLFVNRAALEEARRARVHLEIRSSHRLPRRATRLMRLKVRFAYLDRMRQLVPPDEPPPAPFGRVRTSTAEAAMRLTRHRWPSTLLPSVRAFTVRKSWNLYYYCACVVATTLEDAPEAPAPAADQKPDQDALAAWHRTVETWKTRNDPLAAVAVRALNHSLLVSGRREASVLDEGAMDWLLYEDPDLDLLRLHPRFERWASATFARAVVNQNEADADVWMRGQRLPALKAAEFDNEGVLGLGPRWGRDHRRWWLVSDFYLIESMGLAVPEVAEQWRRLAAEIEAGTGQRLAVDELSTMARRQRLDNAVWQQLTLYRRFGARPDLRLATARDLSALAGPALRPRPFPTSSQALLAPRGLHYADADRILSRLAEGSADDLVRTERALTLQAGAIARRTAVRLCMAAAARWEGLGAVIVGGRPDPLAAEPVLVDAVATAAVRGGDGTRTGT